MTPVRLLVVDDVAAYRLLVKLAVRDEPRFTIVGEASSGPEAILAAGALQPDMVLLDVSMPGMTGLEAIPEIRRAAPRTRIVLHTGLEDQPNVTSAVRAGCSYLEKGLEPRILVQRLAALAPQAPASPSPRPEPGVPHAPHARLDR